MNTRLSRLRRIELRPSAPQQSSFPIDFALSRIRYSIIWSREGGANPPLSRNCKRRGLNYVATGAFGLWEGSSKSKTRKSGDLPGC
jgi:hypothetical protein